MGRCLSLRHSGPLYSEQVTSRWWTIGGPIGVLLLAAAVRLWGLGHPAALMFDETYYVKDAWTMLNLGYEGSWPKDADTAWNLGDYSGWTSQASYMAHPPLGKWIMALGIAALGIENPASWRLSVAVAGILGVALIMFLAKRLWNSPVLTVLAGGFFAIDGHAIVMSRLGLLDNFVMLFSLLAFTALLLDRAGTERRLDAALARARERSPRVLWGPVVWWRPWLLAAGVLLGATTAVKWSGLYFIAFFFLYVVAADGLARRRRGLPFWPLSAVLKQGPINALLVLPAAVGVYLASWTGWFITSGGYDRNWIANGGERWTGGLAWVPDTLQNLWHWHATIYAFHNGLSSPHPYSTPAVLWPFLVRPTQIFYRGSDLGENGCTFSSCSEIVWSIANPILWWAANIAAVYVLYRFLRFAEWRAGLLLIGIAAGYLPWLLYPNRTMFQFYAIAYEPYLILCLVAAIGLLLGIPIGRSDVDNLARIRARLAARQQGSDAAGVRLDDPEVVPAGGRSARAEVSGTAVGPGGGDTGMAPQGFADIVAGSGETFPGDPPPRSGWHRFVETMRQPAVRLRFVIVFLVVVVLVSIFFYPMWTGIQVPFWFWTLHIWTPTWV